MDGGLHTDLEGLPVRALLAILQQGGEAALQLLEAGDGGGFGRCGRMSVKQVFNAPDTRLEVGERIEGGVVERHGGLVMVGLRGCHRLKRLLTDADANW